MSARRTMAVRVRPVRPDDDSDIAAIMDIYCFHITNVGDWTTFEETVPSLEDMRARVKGLLRDGYPYLVAEVCSGPGAGKGASQGAVSPALAPGRVVGYSYVHMFRERAAYSRTVENSIYVHREARGCGVGSALMKVIVQRCKQAGYLQILSVIGSISSANFHRKHGFVWCGTWHHVGVRWNKYVSVHNFQLFLQDEQQRKRVADATASGDLAREVLPSNDSSTPPPVPDKLCARDADSGAGTPAPTAAAHAGSACVCRWLLPLAVGVAAGVLLGKALKT